MDKPTPPKTITTRMLGTGPEVEFVFLTDAIAHGEAMAAWGAAQGRKVEADSRGMFVARLENLQENGDHWLTVATVLALLNDCDMLAQQGG